MSGRYGVGTCMAPQSTGVADPPAGLARNETWGDSLDASVLGTREKPKVLGVAAESVVAHVIDDQSVGNLFAVMQ